MASVNMTSQKFEKWRRALAKELIAAYTHYHIWEQLWPSEEPRDFNRLSVFCFVGFLAFPLTLVIDPRY